MAPSSSVSRRSFVLPLLILVLLMLLAVSGSSARLLQGDGSTTGADEAAFGVGRPIIHQFLKRLYLQQLSGARPSCKTYDPNNPDCSP
ncbi:hypothetical protein BS78_04G271500 [Paspalum vaginatum]|nr:hypothetical protein BS78_04G271300 [Paspalum vaginatum]KAJ1280953.1 hypothetical protein BS78_04G271500 [Paspalum vaginatum]